MTHDQDPQASAPGAPDQEVRALAATVVVPTYGDWEALQECLEALSCQTIAVADFEILVANNNSEPTVPEFLSLPLNARVIHEPTPGSYAARNAGILQARGKVLFFTDSDCRPDTQWVRAGLDQMARRGPLDRLAGHVEFEPNGTDWTTPELFDRFMWLRQEAYSKRGWGVTANLIANRAAFEQVGLFRADLFSGGDREWNLRATAAGGKIEFAKEVVIRHRARPSLIAIGNKQRRTYAGRYERRFSGRARRFVPPLRHLAPSLRVTWEVLTDSKLIGTKKCSVFLVAWWTRIIIFREHLRLTYGNGTRRRS